MSEAVYEVVTENIIKKLEEGTIPWIKPWVGEALKGDSRLIVQASAQAQKAVDYIRGIKYKN